MSILSIQSHVSYGHVGNSAAVFPLQRLGFEVWPVHTVTFSNHAGYETVSGPVLSPEDVRAVIDGMADRGVFEQCRVILSGYLGSARLGEVVRDTVHRVRQIQPDLIYCCDPVIGDVGSDIYVREQIPGFIRDHLLPEATILTPNQFELEYLSGRQVTDLNSAVEAARAMIDSGVSTLLVTSLDRADLPENSIEMLAVSENESWLIRTPKLTFEITPNGAGDMCAALFSGHILRGVGLKAALEATTATVFGIFQASWDRKVRELALIEAQQEIVEPSHHFNAVTL